MGVKITAKKKDIICFIVNYSYLNPTVKWNLKNVNCHLELKF